MKCLDSLGSVMSGGELIIVANGKPLSTEVLTKARDLTSEFILVENDMQVRPGKARNQGIEKAKGEWLFFLDDDAFLRKGYWDIALPLLSDQKIAVLGGPDSPAQGMNALSLSLALALSSPLCTGMTYSRHISSGKHLQTAEEETLTSANLWVRRSILKDVRFPEDYIRAEENCFLQRLKLNAGAFYYHPSMVVGHFRRSRLNELWRPSFYAGFYRSKLMKEKIKTRNSIFWLPAFFVLLHTLIFLEPQAFTYLTYVYLTMVLSISVILAARFRRTRLFPIVAFLHYFIVFMYGVGFISERVCGRWPFKQRI